MVSLAEQVEGESVIFFSVSKCPKPVYDEFVFFCARASKEAGIAGVNYSCGLKKLLDVAKAASAELQPKKVATFGGN